MREPRVREVMTNLVVTFRSKDLVTEAAARMLSNRISGGPVVDRGRVIGVISESDIARALVPPERIDDRAVPLHPSMYLLRGRRNPEAVSGNGNMARTPIVGDCMTREVISVSPSTGVWSAARLLDHRGIKRLPVIDDDGYLVGILARADIVRSVTQETLDSSSR